MLTLVQDMPRPRSESGPVDTAGLSYDELRERGRRAAEAGELEAALRYYERSLELARAADDQELLELAVCNRSTLLITLGRHRETAADLRQILMANRYASNSFLAALNLSRIHVRDKAPKKALFYAQIARDRALALGRDEWLVWSYNQLGNCLTDESRFREAATEYRRALALQPEGRSLLRAQVLVNLGYCLMMLGRMKQGLSQTFRALRWLRSFGARVYEVWPHLDLCYAYVELGRYRRARDHGRRALALAEETGESDRLKNALYLLGDTERAAGNLEGAYEYFSRLQREFYPESPQLVELLLAVGMRQMVNLRA